MKSRNILIILISALIAISVLTSGCTDTDTGPIEEVTATPTPDETATEVATSTETATAEPTVTETATAAPEPQTYTIRIDSYLLIPTGGKEINVGDTLNFRNFEDSRQARVLVSEDGIWEEEQYLSYMRTVSHTFDEPGVYTFYLKGREANKWKVTVV